MRCTMIQTTCTIFANKWHAAVRDADDAGEVVLVST
jgi:hypothetical protein